MATERQKKTLEKLGEGMALSKAMREAGYSPSYSKNPQDLKSKKSFQEIFDNRITDELITKATKQLVNYKQSVKYEFPSSYTEDEVHKAMKKHGFRKSQYFHKKVTETKVYKGVVVQVEYWAVHGSKPSGVVIPKGIDIAMKGKGYYAPDKIAFTDTEGRSLEDDDLDKQIELLEGELRVNYLKKAKKKKNGSRQSRDKKKTTSSKKGETKKT